ncbi:hypothetical protein [Nocardia wallacei]|uniref:hypothetical protein n=1 Tax=Nocardia wallacei TaxID=480035 RepID=UPI00245840F3|nr:hypothetical protein [Nocardia wallacei]
MTALFLLGVVVVVTAATLRHHAPRSGERAAFRQAVLRARHSLTDWGAARPIERREMPVGEIGPRFVTRPGRYCTRALNLRRSKASYGCVDI